MREYDQKLVAMIQEKVYVETVDGIDIVMKPVPDDDRKHIVDPLSFFVYIAGYIFIDFFLFCLYTDSKV